IAHTIGAAAIACLALGQAAQAQQQPSAAAITLATQLLELKGGISAYDPAVDGVIIHHKGVLLQINPNLAKDINDVEQLVRKEGDLFVIGAGSGGVRAARISSGYGARVMIAEEYRVGGTCVIRGCVPKKLLVYASRFAEEFEDAKGFGWTVAEPTFDWATLIANKDKEIDRLEKAYIANLDRAKVKIAKSRAVMVDPHTVNLTATGETVRARQILAANR